MLTYEQLEQEVSNGYAIILLDEELRNRPAHKSEEEFLTKMLKSTSAQNRYQSAKILTIRFSAKRADIHKNVVDAIKVESHPASLARMAGFAFFRNKQVRVLFYDQLNRLKDERTRDWTRRTFEDFITSPPPEMVP